MRLGFCTEDESDEQVYAALVGKVLGEKVEADPEARVIPRAGGGVDNVLKFTPKAALVARGRGLAGFVIAFDNDGAVGHVDGHDGLVLQCRWCRLIDSLRSVDWLDLERPRPSVPICVVALAVQTMETWLLLARGEALLRAPEERGRTQTDRRELKRMLYGTADSTARRRVEVALPLVERLEVERMVAASASFARFMGAVRRLRVGA